MVSVATAGKLVLCSPGLMRSRLTSCVLLPPMTAAAETNVIPGEA
jgi:UPF0716 family protein affecting phage T7 exclusion